MGSWITDNFTEAERNKITELAKREYQDMTPEEVQLYARWESLKAVSNAEFQSTISAIIAESTASIAAMHEMKQAAIESLEAQRDAALAWYESVIGGGDNGEES